MSADAEVCLAHRGTNCTTCDEHNDDLWVHPRDLPAPHEDCPMCARAIEGREWNIANLERTIEMWRGEIAEIEAGKRHTAFHEVARADQ